MPIYLTQPPVIAPVNASVGTVTVVPSLLATTVLLAANPLRLGGSIFNDSTKTLYILFAAGSASNTNKSTDCGPGLNVEILDGYTGVISGAWQAVNGNARVTELTP